jgi:hypothetical protein
MKYECVIVKYHEVHLAVRVFPRAGTVDKVESNGSIALVPESIERRIFLARGQKVMVDSDLASLYGVTTGNMNLAVKRNPRRFPEDFMFQLSTEEVGNLTLQSARSSWGGRRRQPYVFTEHGVAMLSSVLRSERAVQMNILIVRAFVRTFGNWRLARKTWLTGWKSLKRCRNGMGLSSACWLTISRN